MAEHAPELARPTGSVGWALYAISKTLAIFGGFLACVLALMVFTSVTGRYLFAAPIPGDYDIGAIICGSAVFSFLPFCQMVRGNVMVDFFTSGLPARAKSVLDAAGTFFYLVIAMMLTWRLYFGMLELRASNEMLAVVDFHRWWTVPYDLFCMIVLIAVIAYTFCIDIQSMWLNRSAANDTAA